MSPTSPTWLRMPGDLPSTPLLSPILGLVTRQRSAPRPLLRGPQGGWGVRTPGNRTLEEYDPSPPQAAHPDRTRGQRRVVAGQAAALGNPSCPPLPSASQVRKITEGAGPAHTGRTQDALCTDPPRSPCHTPQTPLLPPHHRALAPCLAARSPCACTLRLLWADGPLQERGTLSHYCCLAP